MFEGLNSSGAALSLTGNRAAEEGFYVHTTNCTGG